MGDHIPAAFEGLLGRLEHEADGALQLAFLLLQHFRGGQQHGGVEVVTAGVGLCASGAGEGLSAELRHGQSVHVGPQKQRLSAGTNLRGDTVTAALGLQSGAGQLLHHIRHSLWHFQPYLCVLVEKAAVGNGFRLQLLGKFIVVHTESSLFSNGRLSGFQNTHFFPKVNKLRNN